MPEVEVGSKRSMDYDENQVNKVAKSNEDMEGDMDMEVRLLLLERSCGGIIGKGGENISRLRTSYNVNVQMPSTRTVDRAFTVKGTLENCIAVVKELLVHAAQGPFSTNQQCSFELNLLVQTSTIGSILGKGGERIKEIREATSAKVKVYEECLPSSNERVIAIGGADEQQVLVALTTILNIVKEIPSRSRPRYYNPANKSGDMMSSSGGGGGGGANGSSGYGMNNMNNLWHGDNSNSSVFLQLQTVTSITAPNDLCGAIIGKGGLRIREVRHNSGATINFSELEKDSTSDRVITISGTQQQVQTAEQLISQSMRSYGT